jgi:hypothetical protein
MNPPMQLVESVDKNVTELGQVKSRRSSPKVFEFTVDPLSDFVKADLDEALTSVPGLSDVDATSLRAVGVTTTHQLIGYALMMHTKFAEWLSTVGVGHACDTGQVAHVRRITKALNTKLVYMFSGATDSLCTSDAR